MSAGQTWEIKSDFSHTEWFQKLVKQVTETVERCEMAPEKTISKTTWFFICIQCNVQFSSTTLPADLAKEQANLPYPSCPSCVFGPCSEEGY